MIYSMVWLIPPRPKIALLLAGVRSSIFSFRNGIQSVYVPSGRFSRTEPIPLKLTLYVRTERNCAVSGVTKESDLIVPSGQLTSTGKTGGGSFTVVGGVGVAVAVGVDVEVGVNVGVGVFVGVGVLVDVGVAVNAGVAVDVGVAVDEGVGVHVDVGVGVWVGVFVGVLGGADAGGSPVVGVEISPGVMMRLPADPSD
jgi:hypothetical protein